jgi:hypothetical protein
MLNRPVKHEIPLMFVVNEKVTAVLVRDIADDLHHIVLHMAGDRAAETAVYTL